MPTSVVLLVSALPPSRCGVANYAAEHLQRLREEGEEVTTISPLADSTANLHIDLRSIFGCLSSLIRLWCCKPKGIFLHYADIHFFPWRVRIPILRGICRLLQSCLLRRIGSSAPHSLLVIHEIYTNADMPPFARWTRQNGFIGFDEIAFHTDAMRRDFLHRFPGIPIERTSIIEHSRYMVRKFTGTREDARRKLELPETGRILICLGFIHQTKGFHDAVEAFKIAGPSTDTSLHIIGNMHEQRADDALYAEFFRLRCSETPGVHMHEGWIDDEVFDAWLAAADLVILPYLGVASSGVGARASIYDKPLIIRNLPNLTEQFPDAITFDSTEELAHCLRMS
jgi:glycosyltransferase involved in cell wall biosynthesis